MSYNVRINNQVISVETLSELRERASRWQRNRFSIEVAEAGSQNFLPLDDFLASPHSAPSQQSPFISPTPAVSAKGSGVHPSMFHQSTNKRIQTGSTAPSIASQQPLPPPPTTNTANFQMSGWYVDKDAHMRLHQFIKPEYIGHTGPWLVSGNNLIPIAGYWITGAARIIDLFLFLITIGVYGIFMLTNIAKGEQTVGQRYVGIRMVRSDNIIQSPGYGQLIGLFFCLLFLYIPIIGIIMAIGILAQAFSRRKQGLHHLMCGVMHIEERHCTASRGAVPYIIALIIYIVLYFILILFYAYPSIIG